MRARSSCDLLPGVPPITVPLHAPELAPGDLDPGAGGLARLRARRGGAGRFLGVDLRQLPAHAALPEGLARALRRARADRSSASTRRSSSSPRDPAVVAAAVAAEGIPYPVLLDDDRETWSRFANHYWPAKYLADARGYLRYEHFGEGAYGETEELDPDACCARPATRRRAPSRWRRCARRTAPGAVCHPATRELYLGYHRGRLLAPEGYRPEEEVRHAGRPEEPAPQGMFVGARPLAPRGRVPGGARARRRAGAALRGRRRAGGGRRRRASWRWRWTARPCRPRWRGEDVVERDGRTVAVWERPRMIRLLAGAPFARRLLRVRALRPGVRLYTFTFTSCLLPEPESGQLPAGVSRR